MIIPPPINYGENNPPLKTSAASAAVDKMDDTFITVVYTYIYIYIDISMNQYIYIYTDI